VLVIVIVLVLVIESEEFMPSPQRPQRQKVHAVTQRSQGKPATKTSNRRFCRSAKGAIER
jgi:hypothetical protein